MNEIEVTLIGNVCSDVRHVLTDGGVPLASFRVASTPRKYRGGQWGDGPTTYASVTCWRTLAENAASSISRGDPVIVQGWVTMRSWEKDERSGQTLEIEAHGLGHDLRWGTSAFQKKARKEAESVDADVIAAHLATSFDRDEASTSPEPEPGDEQPDDQHEVAA